MRPSPRPLRVLAARRRLQDRHARRARRELRPAGPRAHRSRRDERRGRALQGHQEARRQADRRARGLLRRRPQQPRAEGRAKPPHAARRDRRRPAQPRQALQRRLPRGPPPRQAGGRPRAAARHAEGVICLTGCLASRSSQRIVQGKPQQARAHLDELVQAFGPEQVYFEVQRNGLAEQEQVNEAMRGFAAEMGRPLVATADVHYLRKEDYHHHAALLCVQTKSTLAQPKMSFETNEFFLKSSEEMAHLVRRHAGGARVLARDRRALRRRDRARQAADPALRVPGRQDREGVPARAGRARACAAATATRRPPRRSSGWRWSSGSSTTWASTPTS